MPTYKAINDLQCSFYEAGLVGEQAIVKVVTRSNPDPVYFYPDELRPLGEWLIKCADEIGNPGYIVPFTGDDEQTERESATDVAQVAFEMAVSEDEIFASALLDEAPVICPGCRDILSHIEYDSDSGIWCMSCGYNSKNKPDNTSPAAIGLPEPF